MFREEKNKPALARYKMYRKVFFCGALPKVAYKPENSYRSFVNSVSTIATVVNDPVVNDPVVNDLVVNDLVVNDLVVNDLVVNDLVVNDLVVNDLVVNDLVQLPSPQTISPEVLLMSTAMAPLSAATAADYHVDNTIASVGGSYSQLLDTLVSSWSTLRDRSPGIVIC
jgi:hypothetical protein